MNEVKRVLEFDEGMESGGMMNGKSMLESFCLLNDDLRDFSNMKVMLYDLKGFEQNFGFHRFGRVE